MEQPRNVNRENKESEDCFDAAVLHNFIDNAKALLYNHFNKILLRRKAWKNKWIAQYHFIQYAIRCSGY
jgi:hypothetical protein